LKQVMDQVRDQMMDQVLNQVVSHAQVEHARSWTTVYAEKQSYTEIVHGFRIRRVYTEWYGGKRISYTEIVQKY
jgi:hypothetical protein